jgi:RND family efflux transporter MFP subunit
MTLNRKAVALTLGLTSMLSVVTIAQAQKSSQEGAQLVIDDARVDWFQKADVAALKEGVVDTIELRLGDQVAKRGTIIGYLHKESADLSVKEAEIQAKSEGGILKAQAQKRLAIAVVMRNRALLKKDPTYVSAEDQQKAEAELEAADASVIEAIDTQKLARAKLDSARRVAEEHIIRAPFAGQILEEFVHEGESVHANAPVVRLGNLDKVRVWAYIPIEYLFRVQPGTKITVQPMLGQSRGKQAIEQMQFKGVISSVDQRIQAIGETAVKVFADLDNPSRLLKPGMRVTMIINLEAEGAVLASPVIKEASSDPSGVGSRQIELPTLPRP